MILASRNPQLTDQLRAATIRAAEAQRDHTTRFTLLADVERLERHLQACLEDLGYRVTLTRRAPKQGDEKVGPDSDDHKMVSVGWWPHHHIVWSSAPRGSFHHPASAGARTAAPAS